MAALLMTPLAMLTGCDTAPSLEVVSAELIETSPQGSVVAFTIQAVNSNEDPLPLRNVDYSANAAGLGFSGVRAGEATLRATGEQTIVIPAAFSGPVAIGSDASITGSVGYTATGKLAELFYEWGVYRPSEGFSGSVVVEAPRPKSQPIRSTPLDLRKKVVPEAGAPKTGG